MSDESLLSADAKTVADLLPALMRQLNAGLANPMVSLPLGQLRVCSVLRRGPQAMSAIGRELGASLSAMTQIADRLERAKLVKRVPRGDDRRVRCLQLTERGERLMGLYEEARIAKISKVLGQLSPAERGEVTGGLQLLLRAAVAAKGQANDARSPYQPTSKVLL
ncbi:MAG: MarR family transcriptional regulator [Thermoguttaceae bacterium]